LVIKIYVSVYSHWRNNWSFVSKYWFFLLKKYINQKFNEKQITIFKSFLNTL